MTPDDRTNDAANDPTRNPADDASHDSADQAGDTADPGVLEHAQVVEEAHEVEPDDDDVYRAPPQDERPSDQDEDDGPQPLLDELSGDDADDDSPEPVGEDAENDEAVEDAPKAKRSRKKAAAKKTTKKAASKQVGSKKASSKKAEPDSEDDEDDEPVVPAQKKGITRMIVNYAPGEECRIAQVEDGQLEEFHAERMDAISRVNNIYVGRVANVESGIQAAFVDFGIGESGFLHVTDLHPRYFPGADDDDSERVGRKTPRRERPPIQQALKRGQEIIVQVLKEGVGTKGPTLTSYLSIPGRYLVMMPQMDQVGVSRKVEDEQTRKDMRKILDGLDLPSEFGFILRTAGIGKTKTELKRDLAYLQRLWKDLDKRHRTGRAPRLLYSESDLLLRALRDFLTPDIDEIVLDNEHALRRASQFLKIAAPRSSVRLRSYNGPAPVFEAFRIEEQLELMQSREVPLPSGGRLVIDQTEAVVAIDVNSGKSRSARDSETNALRTNLEAVDEICRQLRLRDMGGIVINDLIDMRPAKNRKIVENRFKDRLKRDRARSSVASISPFGILEMTRQRMRGSLHSQVFTDCPTCHGRGGVKRPSVVASECIRKLAAILSHDKVQRIELVVGGRVAGEMLSKKRKALARLEQTTGKQVLVRVMDMTEPDRTVYYAYGPGGVDVDIARLPSVSKPEQWPDQWLQVWNDPSPDADWSEPVEEDEIIEEASDPLAEQEQAMAVEDDDDEQSGSGKKKRRRRRRGKGGGASQEANAEDTTPLAQPTTANESANEGDVESEGEHAEDGERPKKKRRRRRRGKGGGASQEAGTDGAASEASEASGEQLVESGANAEAVSQASSQDGQHEEAEDGAPKKKRRRRRRGKGGGGEASGDGSNALAAGGSVTGGSATGGSASGKPATSEPQAEVKPKRRSLYGTSRRKLSSAEVASAAKRKD